MNRSRGTGRSGRSDWEAGRDVRRWRCRRAPRLAPAQVARSSPASRGRRSSASGRSRPMSGSASGTSASLPAVRWAERIGPATAALVTGVLERRHDPQHAYRSCLGILRLAECYGDGCLEAAAERALPIGSASFRSVESILEQRLDETCSMPRRGRRPHAARQRPRPALLPVTPKGTR